MLFPDVLKYSTVFCIEFTHCVYVLNKSSVLCVQLNESVDLTTVVGYTRKKHELLWKEIKYELNVI